MSDSQTGPSSSSSPPMKRHKSTHLSSNEKKIAVNVFKYVEKTMTTYPYKSHVAQTTGEIMRVLAKTILNVIKEYESTGKLSSPPRHIPAHHKVIESLDDFTLSAIRRKVHQFYFDGELPTIDKILRAVNDDVDLPNFSRTTMFRIMKKLNFEYAKRTRKSVLLDRPDLQMWRRDYLLKMADYRKENRKIYYLDETWVNEGHSMNFVWMDKDIESSRQAFLRGLSTGLKNPQKGKRLIVTHIGSTEGFLEGAENIFQAKKSDGDYHGEMDAHNFEKWFQETLEKIEPNSIVVMDNASYHSRNAEQVPNLSWRKDAIQAWLREKNISFNDQEIKVQLLEKFNKNNYKKKFVDELAATKNVTVLRLPPYHCELNPIELIWAQIKSYVGRNNKTFKMADIQRLLHEGIEKIGSAEWTGCINNVIKEEQKMMRLDGLIDTVSDNITERFIIHVESDSEDSDSDKENK